MGVDGGLHIPGKVRIGNGRVAHTLTLAPPAPPHTGQTEEAQGRQEAVRFYSEVLGLKLTNRFGDHWATVDAGKGLTIGLHPASPKYAAPGTKGGITLGLETGLPIEQAVARLKEHGVKVGGIIRDQPGGNFADFEDPDGNPMYLWEVRNWGTKDGAPESELAQAGKAHH